MCLYFFTVISRKVILQKRKCVGKNPEQYRMSGDSFPLLLRSSLWHSARDSTDLYVYSWLWNTVNFDQTMVNYHCTNQNRNIFWLSEPFTLYQMNSSLALFSLCFVFLLNFDHYYFGLILERRSFWTCEMMIPTQLTQVLQFIQIKHC